MDLKRLVRGGVGVVASAALLAGCWGGGESLSSCGPWSVDAEVADSELADYEFLRGSRAESRDEMESIVFESVRSTFALASLDVLVGDTDEVDPGVLPEFTPEIVGERPFPPKPDWVVLSSGDTRWAAVLYDDAFGSAPLDARLDEGWYILGPVYSTTCE